LKTKLPILQTILVLLMVAIASLTLGVRHKRTVTVSFDYDFRLSPPCSPGLTSKCVKQFNVYDMTGEARVKLFSIAVPVGAAGLIKGITGISEPLLLPAGKHLLAVTAESADGAESDAHACSTTVDIKR